MTTPRSAESGSTLVELLLTMVIMATGVVAVLGALHVGIASGHVQRNLSTAELALRSFAEHAKVEAYVECAEEGDYGAGFEADEGLVATITEVWYWDGETELLGSPLTFVEDCAEGDRGLQRLHLRVESDTPGLPAQETVVVKRAT